MVDLLPGVSVDATVKRLRFAAIELGNVRGGTITSLDALNAFRDWAAQQTRVLAAMIEPSSLAELLLTPGYDRLALLDPAAYGSGMRILVDIEIDGVERRLNAAAGDLEAQYDRWNRWRVGSSRRPLHAVVLDTNVMLRHADRLAALDWTRVHRQFGNQPIALGLPLIVIRELDRLKTTTQKMDVDGAEVSTKTRARIALKLIDEWFAGSSIDCVLHQPTAANPDIGTLALMVMIDDLRHVPLPTADAEIIDRAIALRPFTAGVTLATGDRAMRIQARFLGLDIFEP